jgi:tRNA dimethylallyltransferase
MVARGSETKLLVIVGPTASGKSWLAMKAAQKLGGEIICADSRTIYHGLDIGTAKPTKEERALVPHHILDVVTPAEKYSASQFQADANEAIEAARERKHLPIIVGGTGLYIDSVVFGYDFAALPNEPLSPELEAMDLPTLQAKADALGYTVPEGTRQNPRHLRRFIQRGGVTP